MDKYYDQSMLLQLEKTKTALEKNNINAFVVQTKEQALQKVEELLTDGATVALGGTITAKECGVLELLRSGRYNFLDRETAKDKTEIYRKSFFADYYICSSNAVTQNGELYNVDGNGNRVACICYGPSSVIMIVGRNKLTRDLNAAVQRVKTVAAPANCQRLSCDTYCHETGFCMGKDMTEGCKSDGRICSSYVVTGFQRVKGRINVILVNEELGY